MIIKSKIEESTFRRYMTESWEWWKPIWKSDRNGFMRFKGERSNISSLRRRSGVIETGYRDNMFISVSTEYHMNWWQIFSNFGKYFFYL